MKYREVDDILASIDLILPYTDMCIALYTQCFPSACGEKKLYTRLGRDSNPQPPAY